MSQPFDAFLNRESHFDFVIDNSSQLLVRIIHGKSVINDCTDIFIGVFINNRSQSDISSSNQNTIDIVRLEQLYLDGVGREVVE